MIEICGKRADKASESANTQDTTFVPWPQFRIPERPMFEQTSQPLQAQPASAIDENSLNIDHSESTFDGYNASLSLLDISKRFDGDTVRGLSLARIDSRAAKLFDSSTDSNNSSSL